MRQSWDGTLDEVLVVNGVHAAGKSTVGELLGEEEPFRFWPQTSELLLGRGYDGGHIEPFQRAVFDHERARDRYLLQTGERPVVESWHLGNIAYTQNMKVTRSLVTAQLDHLETVLDGVDVRAVLLDIDTDTLWRRSDLFAPGNEAVERFERLSGQTLGAFYDDVRESILGLYEEFDVEYDRIDATRDTDAVVRAVRSSLDG